MLLVFYLSIFPQVQYNHIQSSVPAFRLRPSGYGGQDGGQVDLALSLIRGNSCQSVDNAFGFAVPFSHVTAFDVAFNSRKLA